MNATDTGGPAFPRPASENTRDGTLPDGNRIEDAQGGMTLRDYFAAAAMPAVVTWFADENTMAIEDVADEAYRYADAMLAARKPKPEVDQ